MSEISSLYGIFTIVIWTVTSLVFEYASPDKFCKKHLKNRKKIFFFFAIFSIALFWIQLEEAVKPDTLESIWIGNMILFGAYISWSGYKIFQDYIRIKGIQNRRKK